MAKATCWRAARRFLGNPDCYKDYLKGVKAATPAAVKKAADYWLSDGDYVLELHPYPTSFKTETKLDRSKEPTPGDPMSLKLPALEKSTLSNGLKIVLAERHTAPVVNFTLMVNSGYSADPADATGTANFEQRMLEEGTPTRDSLKIGEELESLSANFTTGANLDWALVNLNTLKSTMNKSLDIYADLILHPAFPQKEFVRLQKETIAGIQREKVTPQSMALRVVPTLLYGKGHPYAVPFTGSGTEASVSKMTRDDLAKFHDTWFKPNNATLLVVGDTTLAEIKPEAGKPVGFVEIGRRSAENRAAGGGTGKGCRLSDRPAGIRTKRNLRRAAGASAERSGCSRSSARE